MRNTHLNAGELLGTALTQAISGCCSDNSQNSTPPLNFLANEDSNYGVENVTVRSSGLSTEGDGNSPSVRGEGNSITKKELEQGKKDVLEIIGSVDNLLAVKLIRTPEKSFYQIQNPIGKELQFIIESDEEGHFVINRGPKIPFTDKEFGEMELFNSMFDRSNVFQEPWSSHFSGSVEEKSLEIASPIVQPVHVIYGRETPESLHMQNQAAERFVKLLKTSPPLLCQKLKDGKPQVHIGHKSPDRSQFGLIQEKDGTFQLEWKIKDKEFIFLTSVKLEEASKLFESLKGEFEFVSFKGTKSLTEIDESFKPEEIHNFQKLERLDGNVVRLTFNGDTLMCGLDFRFELELVVSADRQRIRLSKQFIDEDISTKPTDRSNYYEQWLYERNFGPENWKLPIKFLQSFKDNEEIVGLLKEIEEKGKSYADTNENAEASEDFVPFEDETNSDTGDEPEPSGEPTRPPSQAPKPPPPKPSQEPTPPPPQEPTPPAAPTPPQAPKSSPPAAPTSLPAAPTSLTAAPTSTNDVTAPVTDSQGIVSEDETSAATTDVGPVKVGPVQVPPNAQPDNTNNTNNTNSSAKISTRSRPSLGVAILSTSIFCYICYQNWYKPLQPAPPSVQVGKQR